MRPATTEMASRQTRSRFKVLTDESKNFWDREELMMLRLKRLMANVDFKMVCQ